MVAQAVLFALPHVGSTIPEEHGDGMLANVVGLNAPIGLALGFVALRSRSLVMPTIVHVSLDTRRVWLRPPVAARLNAALVSAPSG